MISMEDIRTKLKKSAPSTPPPDEKNSDENGLQPEICPETHFDEKTGPSLTEQIKLARTWQGETALAIVANLEKLKMLAEVSEEMKGMKL
jgi:hypothetical protein